MKASPGPSVRSLSSCEGSGLLRRAALAAAAVAVSSAAWAEPKEWYVGAATESVSISVLRGNDVFSGNYDYGPHSSGYSVHGGVRLRKYLGIDVGARRVSDVKWTEPFGISGLYESHTTFDAAIDQICVVGLLPIGERWEVYIKGGVGSYRLDGEQTFTDLTGASLTGPVAMHGTDIPIAGGVTLAVGKNWHLALELSSVTIKESFIGVSSNDSASLGGWSLGADYRFGAQRARHE